jgi:hypothetical protein
MLRALAVGILLLMLTVLPSSGRATTLNELKVGIRVIEFMSNPPRGKVSLALIYDPQVKASVDDAQSLLHWLTDSGGTGKSELVPILADVRQLDEGTTFRIGFVAAGMETHYAQIFEYARRNQTLIISADLSCVRAGKCTVGVAGAPRVEVIISQRAALSCGIEFTEAFRMMVTEN